MKRDKPTLLVLGGRGVLGTMIAAAAEAAGWTAIRTSRRAAAGFCRVDLAEPETLEAALDLADVTINTIPDEQLTAERMILRRGGLLVNVSALPAWCTARLRGEPGLLRGTVMMNAGLAPGLTNLLAADLLARHPEADEVQQVFTVSVRGGAGPAGAGTAYGWLTGGRHPTVTADLPEPYGRRRCLGIAELDRGWLGRVADGRPVSTYLCLHERPAHRALLAVNAAGLTGRIPRAALGRRAGTRAATEPVRHWVGVLRAGTLLDASSLRCQGDYRSAANASVLIARQLSHPAESLPPGVIVPEGTLSVEELRPGLADAGITVVREREMLPVGALRR